MTYILFVYRTGRYGSTFLKTQYSTQKEARKACYDKLKKSPEYYKFIGVENATTHHIAGYCEVHIPRGRPIRYVPIWTVSGEKNHDGKYLKSDGSIGKSIW